jgi:hypothetical protein
MLPLDRYINLVVLIHVTDARNTCISSYELTFVFYMLPQLLKQIQYSHEHVLSLYLLVQQAAKARQAQ